MSDSEVKEIGTIDTGSKVVKTDKGYAVVTPGARISQRSTTEFSTGTETKAQIVKIIRDYEARINLPPTAREHLIDYGGGIVIADPRYYPSRTVERIVSLANDIIDSMEVPEGRKLSRLAGVARAVKQIMPYDFETRGMRADKHQELTEMDEKLGLLTVCRHQAPATVAALDKIGFHDAVLVIHYWKNKGTSHALAFVPSRDMFVDGTSGSIY